MSFTTKQIGFRLRKWREEAGVSQEWFAASLQELGLDWSGSTIAKLERGERDTIDLDAFAALHVAASRHFGIIGLHAWGFGGVHGLPRYPMDKKVPPLPSDVDRRVAAVLGIEPSEVARRSIERWGHSWIEERGRRGVGPKHGADAGHITRQMLREIRDEWDPSSAVAV